MTERIETLAWLAARWRDVRHPRIAALAEAVGAACDAEAARPPVTAGAWNAVLAQDDPLDFARLVAAIGDGGAGAAVMRVNRLAARDDPRFGCAMLALVERPPFSGAAGKGMFSALFEALVASRDHLAARRAQQLVGSYLGRAHNRTGMWITERLGRAAAQLAALPIPELTPEVEARCAELEAVYGIECVDAAPAVRRTLDELVAEVYADPDDDGARQVVADALLDQGDPRGEWIALDLARGALDREGRARHRELGTREQLAAWAQPLSSAGHVTFERGFPHAIRLFRNAQALLGAAAFATIRRVDGIDKLGARARELLEHPMARHVRDVRDVSQDQLATLIATPRAWTSLHAIGPLPALANLPALRELSLFLWDATEVIHVPAQLERFDVRGWAVRGEWASGQRAVLARRLVVGPALRELGLHVDTLRHLDLAHDQLRALRVTALEWLPPGVLATQRSLARLTIERAPTTAVSLAGLPITTLVWKTARPSAIVDPLPLVHAALRVPATPDELAAFLARTETLRSLALHAQRGDEQHRKLLERMTSHLEHFELHA